MPRMLPSLLAGVLWSTFAGSSWADPRDERIVAEAGLSSQGPALLKFLEGLVPRNTDPQAVEPLIQQLAAEDFFRREEAHRKILTLGAQAIPALRRVLKEPDRELVLRAEICLKVIESGPGTEVHAAVLRLLGERKPPGGAAVLLKYLPFAANEMLAAEAARTLGDLAAPGGKVDPVVIESLKDPLPTRRAAAAGALARTAFQDHQEALRSLLKDPDARVRSRVALALAERGERAAVPVLIALLEDLAPDRAALVEDFLYRLAGDAGPTAAGTDPAAKRKLWAAWWKTAGGGIDLVDRLKGPKLQGRILLVEAEEGKVREIDAKGKELWSIAGLGYPVSAQIVGENRILIAEYRLRRVTLRDFKGKIEKQFNIIYPTSVQQLPGGNILVAARTRLVEYDQNGTQRSSRTIPGTIVSARRLPTGETICLTSTGQCVRLDRTHKEIARFAVGRGLGFGTDIAPAPGGKILFANSALGKVIEFDAAGKQTREWRVEGAADVQRLTNGHLIVCCPSRRKVVELDERGRVVREQPYQSNSNIVRASLR